MSASALAGCDGKWPTIFTPPPGCYTGISVDSPNWLLAYGTISTDSTGASNWYVFQYVPVASAYYNAFALQKNASNPPPAPSQTTVLFDVMTWYHKYQNEFDKASGIISVTTSSRTFKITASSGKVTDQTSMQALQGFMSKYVPCSWNEIGN